MEETRPHSEEYFGTWRNFWWNPDFLALMARRWRVDDVHRVLDVGCGVGHWGRTLLPFLPPSAHLTGLDMEPESVAQARRLAAEDRCAYEVGRAQALPFANDSFDMVTCQTVLIHVPDVPAVLREMYRVLRPGGLFVAAEPNNAVDSLVENSVSFDDAIEPRLARVRLSLVCEAGKANLGLGHNSIGDLLPGLFAQTGLEDIQIYLNDHPLPYLPPYESDAQKANVAQMLEWVEQEFYLFNRDDSLKYFLAGGGERADFDVLWDMARQYWHRFRAGVLEGTLHTAGGSIFYLVSGRKPGTG